MPEPDPRRARLAELRQRLEELGRMVSAATGNPWGRGKPVVFYKELQRRGDAASGGRADQRPVRGGSSRGHPEQHLPAGQNQLCL